MITHSESLAGLGAALAKAQGEIENASKNAANPHFRSKYADLAEIINTVRPVLSKHGLSVVQIPGFDDGVVTVDTILLHSSGEWISGASGAPIGKADAQGVGSAVTYLRRYSLAAVCGIAQEDDDGNAAVVSHGPSKQAERDRPLPTLEPEAMLLPFGDKKGTPLGELDTDELEKIVAWCVSKKKFPDLQTAAEAVVFNRLHLGVAA